MFGDYIGVIQKIVHNDSPMIEYFVSYEYISADIQWLFQRFKDYLYDEMDVVYNINIASDGATLQIKNPNKEVCQTIERIAENSKYQLQVKYEDSGKQIFKNESQDDMSDSKNDQFVGVIQKTMHGASLMVEYFVAYEYIPSGLRWLFQQFEDHLHDEKGIIYEVNLMSRGAILRIKNANMEVQHAIERIAEKNRYQVQVRRFEYPARQTFKNESHDNMHSSKNGQLLPDIREIIQNGPATIIKWDDNTKTIVKLQDKDQYNPMLGVMLCISKKAFGCEHLAMLKDKMDLSDKDFDALFTEALHPKPKSQPNNGKTSL